VAEEKIKNWANKTESDIYEECLKFYSKIKKAYKNRKDADDAIDEYWKIYNAEADDNQVYQGNSSCYVPVVRDAINARARRALKQLFPAKYKHVDAIGSDGERPLSALSLLEHYIRVTKLKSITRSMLVAGDVTGQWNLYVDWISDIRDITPMVKRNPVIDDELVDKTSEEEVEDEQRIVKDRPTAVDFAVEDLVVIPPTCNEIEDADLVGIKLRMSKSQVEKMVDDGIFIIDKDSDVSDWMDANKGKEPKNPPNDRTDEAGIKTEGTNKYLLVFEVTARIEFEDGKKSLAYIYYAGEDEIIGIIKAPQWGQKRPILSAPVDRIAGSFFGRSKIEPVKWMQWNLNDFWNMGQDSAMYSLLPIVMTDPEKNPNYAMMVYGLAAVWPVDPNSTKFNSFPQLWKDSIQMCSAIKSQIHESLDVNEGMMGAQPKGRKNAGAMGAQQQEQSVAVIDHAERVEEEILNPLMERFFEYDCQFREEEIGIMVLGEVGFKATLQNVPPMQWDNRYFFQWSGTDYVMNMQRMQQQIATMNVLRGIPPQQLNGRRLDIAPILEVLTDNVFGAELSSRILIDDRLKFTIPPEIEDEMMHNLMSPQVHTADDDAQHIPVHQKYAMITGDEHAIFRTHIESHMRQMQTKRQEQMAAMQPPPGQPGVPGGAGPGVAGSPRMGAQPQGPRMMQQQAGAIHPDQMPGQPGRG
jgi:hypothetical protein